MSPLKEEVALLRKSAGEQYPLSETLSRLYTAMQEHSDELKGITVSLSILATDTSAKLRFSIKDGVLAILEDELPAAVEVSGSEKNLISFIRGELSPAKAILLRKIVVHGDIGQLSKLAAFL